MKQSDIFHKAFVQAKTPTCILSPEGVIRYANPAHRKLFRLDDEPFEGISFADIIGRELLEKLLADSDKTSSFSCTTELPLRPGITLQIELSASNIRDESKRTGAVIVISRDRTRRRESDRKLIRFRNMIDNSNDAFFVIEASSGKILDVNETACRQLGYDREEILQLGIRDINPQIGDYAEWVKELRQLLNKERTLLETEHQEKSGRTFPVEISVKLIEDPSSACIIAIARDISERKEAEERERKAQREWARTFDSSSDIITLQGLDFRITQCNRAASEAFDLPKEQIIGRYCYEIFAGSESCCHLCPALSADGGFEPSSMIATHEQNGKNLSINISPIFDDQGQVTGIAHFAKDITERKELEEQLKRAQKMEALGTLAGGIAHDFNNILSAIMGYTQLAQLHTPAEAQAHEALNQVLVGGRRATELVKQILMFSRKTEYQMGKVDVAQVIIEACKLLRPSLPTTIEIRQNIAADCPAIRADEGQIHQVVMNLCTNAYHAMRDRKTGILEIGLRPTKSDPQKTLQNVDQLELWISDTGTGMDSRTLEKIFEPYFTTKQQDEGTGLGLAVVHGIIHDFGGRIHVDSTPGQGSCFHIYLPVPDAEQPVVANEENSRPVPSGNERLLIVDDEEPIAELMKSMLEYYGYQVTCKTESVEALRTFEQNPDIFDLVLTDFAMPRLNGVTLAEELLKIREDLPILLCTGFNDNHNRAAALQSGVRACLEKPIQAEQLAIAVRKTLDSSPC